MRALLIAMVVSLVPSVASALDVEPWDRVLRAHARNEGFDYAGLARDEAGRRDLATFLESVATMREDEPLSSWLNAYDAIVVSEIVERWPLESVMRVPGFFDRERHRVAGRERTLDDVEHRVIRARFRDARVHAALVCGARSCPALHPRAFRESDLDATLDRLTRAWMVSDRGLRVEGGTVRASAILTWYRADFERDGGGSVLGWLRRYAPERVRGISDGTAVGELGYDWSVNQARALR
ncbi:DUF547 domain-containing protein [Sandaracinus amylolyticus]|uniref:DUF547 domain-containing protein n=1 Tax=Sandaracinus amylolyticus TaxID=927083 RepID=A0A0F6W3C1_9BACT|nr:DUF547 domain-containing protein [Sandaracinus amylolyticus]AKF06221.1 Hypothetical protein DB32_003370 [Sandaracinus amylolyticus]